VALRPDVRERAKRGLPESEPTDDVLRRDWVREELAVVVDARQARPGEELVLENGLPEAFDLLELGKEAMSSEVEAIAVELDGLRDPADTSVRLEDDGRTTTETKGICAREASRSASKNGIPDRLARRRVRSRMRSERGRQIRVERRRHSSSVVGGRRDAHGRVNRNWAALPVRMGRCRQ